MNIVFVHLNTKLPKYLILNVENCVGNFPEHKVFLIHNLTLPQTIKGATLIRTDYVEASSDLSNKLNHPAEFRNGFWFSSIARLIILAEFMEAHPEPLLHVESDVILSSDFPFGIFENINEPIAYPVVFKERGVASTIYMREKEISTRLADFAVEEVSKDGNTTDMLILRKFFDTYPNDVYPLHFFHTIDHKYVREVDARLLKKISDSPKKSIGLFDGSDLGVYYFGTDPRNARGKSYLRHEVPLTYLRLKNWNLVFDKNRNFPNAKFKNEIIPIFSLHLTSKRLKYFKQDKAAKAIYNQLMKQNHGPATEFYFDVLLKQSMNSLKRRALSVFKNRFNKRLA